MEDGGGEGCHCRMLAEIGGNIPDPKLAVGIALVFMWTDTRGEGLPVKLPPPPAFGLMGREVGTFDEIEGEDEGAVHRRRDADADLERAPIAFAGFVVSIEQGEDIAAAIVCLGIIRSHGKSTIEAGEGFILALQL